MELTGRWIAAASLAALALAGCASNKKSDVRLEMTREVRVQQPGLTALQVEPSGRLDTRDQGREIRVTMTGDPGLQASFDVPGRLERQALSEVSPGEYAASFQVEPGEVGEIKVVGTLLHPPSGGKATREADTKLTLFTSPPAERPERPVEKAKADPCAALDATLQREVVFFDFDAAQIPERAKGAIEAAKRAVLAAPQCRLWLFGHTDSIGAPAYNDYLSTRRAQNVAASFAEAGIPRDRIEVRGLGNRHPVATTGGASSQAANRRVEIRTTNPYGG